MKGVNLYMQFNLYKENVNRYIDDYYVKLIQEIEQRPVSSYPIIFEEELSTLKRYSHSLFKEVLFDMQEELEQSIAEEVVQDKMMVITKLAEQEPIQPISYEHLSTNQSESLLVKKNPVKTTLPGANGIYKVPTISGGVAGAAFGGLIGKTLTLATLGALSGGVLAFTATYYYLHKKSPKNESAQVTVKKPVSEKRSVIPVLESRKLQIKSDLMRFIDKIEEQYLSIISEGH